MPLKVKHVRMNGDHRLVDLKGETDFKITYTGDSRLRLRFRDHIKGAKWHTGHYDAGFGVYGFYLLPVTKENATAILKFGIENDFTFSPRCLQLMSSLSKS